MSTVFLQFFICSVIILFAGRKVVRYGDIIAEKTQLGGLWVGLILLAVATSLPEIFTGIGSIIFAKNPNLTVGNLLGANSYNLLNIALLETLHKGGPLLTMAASGHLLTAWLSLVPIVIVSVGIALGKSISGFSIGHVSLVSILVLFSYFFATRRIFIYEKKQHHGTSNEVRKYEGISLRSAGFFYSVNACIIIGAGIWLSFIGEGIVRAFSLNASFVGTLFLGFATTLPELVVSIAALRIGARDMAVANMLGSNLFNMVVVFINDVFYVKGPIFDDISPGQLFSSATVIMMTMLIIGVLRMGKRFPSQKAWMYSWGLVIIFVIGVLINYMRTM